MRPHFLTLLFLTALALSPVPVQAQQTEQSIKELLKRISAELPRGWTVTHEIKDSVLEVTRQEPVLAVSARPNSDPSQVPALSQYSFAFRTAPAISTSDYRELALQNRKTKDQMQQAYEALVQKHVSQKFDSFRPANAEEKAMVDRYESLKYSLQPLPSYYFRDVSLSWAFGSLENPLISVIDEPIRAECRSIQEKVTGLLTKYQKDKSAP